MNKEIFNIIKYVKDNFCTGCDVAGEDCDECAYQKLIETLSILNIESAPSQEGCHICLTKQGRPQEVFYDDGRGGLRIAEYCPLCGRKISG